MRRCQYHAHEYPSRKGDAPEVPEHQVGDDGYDIGQPWCSVVAEEWHDNIDLDTLDCDWVDLGGDE